MLIIVTFILNAGLNFLLGLCVAAGLGPESYGKFSIAFVAATALAMLLFDWLRLSATRFYREDTRVIAPELRASLDAGYFAGSGLLVVVACALSLAGFDAGLGTKMLGAVALVAIGNGFFDYFSALLRARFRNAAYSGLVILKNLLAFAAMVGAAFWTRDPLVVMICAGVSAGLATFVLRGQTRDSATRFRQTRPAQINVYLRYGAPIVVANLFYQAIALANRSFAAAHLGYAASGELSLATDVTLRLMLAAGAALDIYLFQVAVHKKALEGQAGAQAQVRRNSLMISAALLLLGLGFMADMPAFAALVAPARFRDSFAQLAVLLAPGVALFCLGQFCLNPIAQLEGRTGGVLFVGLATAALDLGWMMLAAPQTLAGFAMVHSVSLAIGFVLMLGLTWQWRAYWPDVRDILRIALAGLGSAGAMSLSRNLQPALLGLLLTAVLGAGVYGALVLALDPGGLFRPAAARVMAKFWRRGGGIGAVFNRLG